MQYTCKCFNNPQISSQLISIYFMISLTKMSKKIIKDIP